MAKISQISLVPFGGEASARAIELALITLGAALKRIATTRIAKITIKAITIR
jgi:hypothetical protein